MIRDDFAHCDFAHHFDFDHLEECRRDGKPLMPNATCFLIAYALVLLLEVVRLWVLDERWRGMWGRISLGMFVLAFVTHSLYLVDLAWRAFGGNEPGPIVSTWEDWGILAAWTIAIAYGGMLWRRSDKQIGLFLLPLILVLVSLSVFFPSAGPIVRSASSVSFWRLVHSMAMLVGTMLVTLGFAFGVMYLVHAWKLKHRSRAFSSFRLPSLEYLQSMGRQCILGSAGAIGFGVISGAIMNFTRDGSVAWTDRGILLTSGMFVWLCIAAAAQRISAHRGRGEWTAAVNLLSFLIVVLAIAAVVSAPHGAGVSNENQGASGVGQIPVDAGVPVKAGAGVGR